MALLVGCCLHGLLFLIANANKNHWTWSLSRASGPKRCSPSEMRRTRSLGVTRRRERHWLSDFCISLPNHRMKTTRSAVSPKSAFSQTDNKQGDGINAHPTPAYPRTYLHTRITSSGVGRRPACMNRESLCILFLFVFQTKWRTFQTLVVKQRRPTYERDIFR